MWNIKILNIYFFIFLSLHRLTRVTRPFDRITPRPSLITMCVLSIFYFSQFSSSCEWWREANDGRKI